MGSQSQTVSTMTTLKNLLLLITLCLGLAAAQQEDGEARLLFSNYTSGLLKLTTVNSTTYGLISLIVGGAALAIAFGYLITASPTFQSQFRSHYRSFNDEPSTNLRSLLGDLDILGLVTKAIKVYEAINEEEEE